MFELLAIANLYEIPVTSPELKFLIILAIILFAPLVLDRLRIPHILGMIMAGAIIGEHGLNLLERDSGIVMSGTAGLLYIMFLAGLEIDMNEFVRNRWKSIVFGLFTFVIPMVFGTLAGIYLLESSMMTALLLASMFASHTLLAYPLLSRLGVKRNRAVTVAIGGTVIAETLALLVLAVVVGMVDGEVNTMFWVVMTSKVALFSSIIFFLFPLIASHFLKRFSDGMAQYIFVLFMLFLGAILAQIAGIEGIIGALFTGLALNRLIPSASALMNRIEFVGNAIFIPFFLIGVGMLIDYRVFISDPKTLYTAFIMTVVAILTKYVAAWITQKSFGYSTAERSVIFGLSSARAAATLAVVLVGYNIILDYDAMGDPIRLLDDSILNGTIIMIFITCTVASIAAQRGGYELSMNEAINIDEEEEEEETPKILLPFYDTSCVETMIGITHLMIPARTVITVANVISDHKDENAQILRSRKIVEKAQHCASSYDRPIETLQRYDTSYANGVANMIRENSISDLILSINPEGEFTTKLISKFVDNATHIASVTTILCRSMQPIATIRRHIIILPPNAELETGFRAWIIRVGTLVKRTGATAILYGSQSAIDIISAISKATTIKVELRLLERYTDILIIAKEVRKDDNIIFAMARKIDLSYNETMESIPYYINNYFTHNSFMLIYPYQVGAATNELDGLTNAASISAVNKIEDVIEGVLSVIKPRKR